MGCIVRACLFLLGVFTLTCSASDEFDYSEDYGSCYRPCDGGPPRTCYYHLVAESYNVLSAACRECANGVEDDCKLPQCVSADGIERTVFPLNRRIPGPGVHVCKGDTVVVDLEVKIPGHQECIHWHGILQRGTQFMDGVPMITQCPVEEGQTFRYNFEVPDPGTYFYHSHSGINKANGVLGPMVVRQPKWLEPNGHLYDLDLAQHTIILQDWQHVDADFVWPGLTSRTVGQPADSILINGRGRTTNTTSGEETKTVLSYFDVKPGLRYRFRVTNAGSMACPMEIAIEGHKLLLIETDAGDMEPMEVGRVTTFSGERYSFVVSADQPSGVYWIHARTSGFCLDTDIAVDQVAILRYEGSNGLPNNPRPKVEHQWPGPSVGDPGEPCGSPGFVCPTELRSKTPERWPHCNGNVRRTKPDLTIVLAVGFYNFKASELYEPGEYAENIVVGNLTLAGHINNISFANPSSPLLVQPGDSPICDANHKPEKCAGKGICECTHVVQVPLNAVVDFVVVDQTTSVRRQRPFLAHPMHLHGHEFAVLNWAPYLDISNGPERVNHVAKMAKEGSFPEWSNRPVMKDTIALPPGGYTHFRACADNPGVWFFHCHFTYHMASGMEMAIMVGDTEDFPEIPEGFPTCGDYRPHISKSS